LDIDREAATSIHVVHLGHVARIMAEVHIVDF
jgi:hypothetical protein